MSDVLAHDITGVSCGQLGLKLRPPGVTAMTVAAAGVDQDEKPVSDVAPIVRDENFNSRGEANVSRIRSPNSPANMRR